MPGLAERSCLLVNCDKPALLFQIYNTLHLRFISHDHLSASLALT